MTARLESLISRRRRLLGLGYLKELAAWMRSIYDVYQARRREREVRETLQSMSPELLDDIGIKIDEYGKPTRMLARQNPHVIATEALTPSPRYHDPY
jgi:uncharacterized protein YjiS (DUF1127 family)